MPAHNAEQFLASAVASALAQTTESLELLVVDDNSSDRTAEVAQEAANDDARVKVYSGTFGTAGKARNFGAAQASGTWLLFLDADDLVDIDHVENLLEAAAISAEVELVFGQSRLLWPDGIETDRWRPPSGVGLARFAAASCPFDIHSALIRRALFDRLGGFDDSLAVGEDWMLWQKAIDQSAQLVETESRTAVYRLLPASVSRSASHLSEDGVGVIGHGHQLRACQWETPAEAVRAETSAIASYLLWVLGRVVSAGGNAEPAIADLAAATRHGSFDDATSSFLDSLSTGTCVRPEAFSGLDDAVRANAADAIVKIGAVYGVDDDHVARAVSRLDVRPAEPGILPVATAAQRAEVVQRMYRAAAARETPSSYMLGVHRVMQAVLPDVGFAAVLEIGCGPGILSVQLAERCEKLFATDFAPLPVARARRRAERASSHNIEFAVLDPVTAALPGGLDLVVVSNRLQLLTEVQLRDVIDAIVRSLRPGGRLLHYHRFDAAEREAAPGFGARGAFGCLKITEEIDRVAAMKVSHRRETDLHRIELWRKTEKPVELRSRTDPVDVSGLSEGEELSVLWHGYETSPALAAQELTNSVAIVRYGPVQQAGGGGAGLSARGLAAQLEYLRLHGYRSADQQELKGLVSGGRLNSGRPVALAFSGSSEQFRDVALPVVESFGFRALFFAARRDTQNLQELTDRGVEVGCEVVPPLHSGDLLRSELRAHRQELAAASNQRIVSFGCLADDGHELASWARLAGFELGFTTGNELCTAGTERFSIPTIAADSSSEPFEVVRTIVQST